MIASKEINDIVYRRDAFLSKTLIRKVAKTFQGNPGMSEPSFSINSHMRHISRIQTQFHRSLYRGLLIEGSVTGLADLDISKYKVVESSNEVSPT